MALILADRVQQTGTANTTVSFTLSGSVTGFQSFTVIGNGNTTYYSAFDASGNWEVGVGTYATGGTLTRTTIAASSNAGAAVTFSGAVNVFITYPAEYATIASNNPGTTGYVLTSNGTGVAPTWQQGGVGTITTTDFTATSGQTIFTVSYTVGLVSVYRNGVKLGNADYTAINGTSITLATGAITGDLIEVQAFNALNLATAVSSFSGNSTGLTPSTPTAGAIVLGGTLNVANGGTGATSAATALTSLGAYPSSNPSGYISTAVTSAIAGTGVSVSGATGAVTFTNSGVTSIVAGTGISISGATGAVTVTNSSPGAVTSVDGQTGAVVTTNLYSIGSFVIGRPANYTVYGVNSTIAGSSLYGTSGANVYNRYNGWDDANISLVNTGSWRCVSIAGTFQNNADLGSMGLWVRYS